MTKKHYTAIASIVNLNFDGTESVLVNDLADYFEQDNPRFNRTMFLTACGIETKGKCNQTPCWCKNCNK